MSATPSKLFAGFIGFIISVCLFAGAGTAKQIAETESHVVLEVGTRGILPCRIQTKAHLVQWTRHLISEHLLVYLDPYSNVGRRGGPGYKAELFNISVDYSLVIKNVKVRDQGLYICEVSDFQTGKVIRNRTRVSVQGYGIGTADHVVLEMGTQGILPCRIQWRAYTVKWKRQLMSETELLVSLDTYFDVGARDGQGYKAGLFNITDDYSLVIKDVKVQDEGLYFCTFSDYKTGKVFRNGTRVSVRASPNESFPVIQECIGKYVHPSACTLTVDSTSELTCLVEGYYPDIDLFFLHGSEKLTSIKYEEWNNADGTKNKNITIRISVSDEPYQCMASKLPGIAGNRSVSVNLQAPPQGSKTAAIFVSIGMVAVFVVGVLLSRVIYNKYHCTKLKDLAPEGPVSKPELWELVTKAKKNNAFKENMREVLRRLKQLPKTAASKPEKEEDFYESLCKWKIDTSSNSEQRKTLYSVCCRVGMYDITRKLADFVMNTSYQVSRVDIEHILWETGDTRKITELLKALELDHEAVVMASEKGRREMIEKAREELLKWRNGKFRINPVVTLSLKLDDTECETNFFKIQLRQKEEICEDEMRDTCCKIYEPHYKSLLKAILNHHKEDLKYQIGRFVDENNESLFCTLEMLRDWIQNEECSSYEKRNKLRKATEGSLQRDHDTGAKWPPNDDLRVIASFLSRESMKKLCSKLGITSLPQEASEEELFQAIIEWRDDHASSKDLQKEHTDLFNALKEVERGGLIPRVKGHLVYKAELVDLAFHLLAQDLLPVTEALGISAAKLVAYRPTFQPSHMKQGTIGLLCKLSESGERSRFLEIMKEMPYPNVFASAMLAFEISFGEIWANSVDQKFTKSTSVPCRDHNNNNNKTCSDLIHGDATCNECIQQESQSEFYNETTDDLATMLKSANDVKDQEDKVSPEFLTFFNHFNVWRKRPRLAPFNFRLVLANSLRSKDRVSDFFRGDYGAGKIPFTFIYNILLAIDPKQRYDLGKTIRDAPFNPVAARLCIFTVQEEEWSRPQLADGVIRDMYAWTEKWIQQMVKGKCKEVNDGFPTTTEIAEKHREFNDELVDKGFFDLAREIMICEQLDTQQTL